VRRAGSRGPPAIKPNRASSRASRKVRSDSNGFSRVSIGCFSRLATHRPKRTASRLAAASAPSAARIASAACIAVSYIPCITRRALRQVSVSRLRGFAAKESATFGARGAQRCFSVPPSRRRTPAGLGCAAAGTAAHTAKRRQRPPPPPRYRAPPRRGTGPCARTCGPACAPGGPLPPPPSPTRPPPPRRAPRPPEDDDDDDETASPLATGPSLCYSP
jgi:hypothetical protein